MASQRPDPEEEEDSETTFEGSSALNQFSKSLETNLTSSKSREKLK